MNHNNIDLPGHEEEKSFAELLEESLPGSAKLEPGQKISATILQIGDEWVFLDVGQKGEGVLDKKELLDEDGSLTVQEGETINAYFMSRKGGELRFTTRLGGSASGTAQLEEAWHNAIPVEGRIEKEIKGGYEIKLPGQVRAFCPYSQVGMRTQETPAELIGSSRSFRITQFSEEGRNIVVSHRVLLEEERQSKKEALLKTIKEGAIVTGRVTHIRDFGAFVDIGGIEGLLPISEIAHGRVDSIEDRLHVDQILELSVKNCDFENEKFSFSLRDRLEDPWKKAETSYPVGSIHNGQISRLTKFGAFVTLEDGIDGLLHISKMGGDLHIKHPGDTFAMGQSVKVVVEKIDLGQKRISLTLAGAESKDKLETSYTEDENKGLGTFADLFHKARKTK